MFNMPKNNKVEINKADEDLNITDLGLDLGDDDLLITVEESLTVIIEDDEDLTEDEDFLLGLDRKKNSKKVNEDEDIEDFDSYFFQEE